MSKRLAVTFTLDDSPDDLTAIGRDGWMLLKLVKAGDAGVTSIENIGPRASHYVLKLRRMGVQIETKSESHGGVFAGSHGRYILRSKVKVVDLAGGAV